MRNIKPHKDKPENISVRDTEDNGKRPDFITKALNDFDEMSERFSRQTKNHPTAKKKDQ